MAWTVRQLRKPVISSLVSVLCCLWGPVASYPVEGLAREWGIDSGKLAELVESQPTAPIVTVNLVNSRGAQMRLDVMPEQGRVLWVYDRDEAQRCEPGPDRRDRLDNEPVSNGEELLLRATRAADSITSAVLEGRIEHQGFDGRSRWTFTWKRYLGEIPFNDDACAVEVCDETGKVISVTDGFLTIPPDEDVIPAPLEGDLRRFVPFNDIVATLTGPDEAGKNTGGVLQSLEDRGIQVVRPNGMFTGRNLIEILDEYGERRTVQGAFAHVVQCRVTVQQSGRTTLVELWLAPGTGRVLGGTFFV